MSSFISGFACFTMSIPSIDRAATSLLSPNGVSPAYSYVDEEHGYFRVCAEDYLRSLTYVCTRNAKPKTTVVRWDMRSCGRMVVRLSREDMPKRQDWSDLFQVLSARVPYIWCWHANPKNNTMWQLHVYHRGNNIGRFDITVTNEITFTFFGVQVERFNPLVRMDWEVTQYGDSIIR